MIEPTRTGKAYWRSLDDYVESPEFRDMIEREFPSQLENVIKPANRRSFLKLMGASLALAGISLSGCRRWPEEKIAPFAYRPEGYIPGKSNIYASAIDFAGTGRSIIVTSYDGRPVKVDGNELDPNSQGASDAYTQASILEMYDPDRSRGVVRTQRGEQGEYTGEPSSWQVFDTFAADHFAAYQSGRGEGLAFLYEATSSPSQAAMMQRARTRFPNARWYEYEPVTRDNEREGSRQAFGARKRAHYDLASAECIVSLDADVLYGHPNWLKHARDFASRRRAEDGTMVRLFAAESMLTVTGSNADHRLAIKSSRIAALASALVGKLSAGVSGLESLASAVNAASVSLSQEEQSFVDAAAADLLAARRDGKASLMVAGPRQPAEVHALMHRINDVLGNIGQTVRFTDESDGRQATHAEAIRSLVSDIRGNAVNTLIVIGGNPVYDAPADLGFAEAFDSIETTIHLSLYRNETSVRSIWHLNRAHALESWGDVRCYDGRVAVAQPLIEPLFEGRTPLELLALVTGDELRESYDIVRRTTRPGLSGDFERSWRQVLHDGHVPNSAWVPASASTAAGEWTARLRELAHMASPGMELVLVPDAKLYDGRFANNGWLQELPDPIAKTCWDNAAHISPRTAEAMGVRGDDLIWVETPAGRLRVPVNVLPGHADDSMTLSLGYGRTNAGQVGNETGFNSYQLRSSNVLDIVTGISVSTARGRHMLARTQDHHVLDTRIGQWGVQTRLPDIVKEANLAKYNEEGAYAFKDPTVHHPPTLSLWEEYAFDKSDYRWGMTVDLSACIGCSACVVACQSENNIPIVGRDQVQRGREMHWLRIDRYFKGYDTSRPDVVFQPVTCQHCETAPCEQVCPVAATVHDEDGLNVMVYNRCVGTRYCSNNCPYKVRRFNFYDWHDRDPRSSGLSAPVLMMPDQQHARAFEGDNQIKKMGFNPEVSVRPRGVMEKCTFCVQRLAKAKIEAKNEWSRLKPEDRPRNEQGEYARIAIEDGTVVTACAQACPTEAIVFGDLNDPQSQVSRLFNKQTSKRAYVLLDELHTKPRLRYLAKLRNPSPAARESHQQDATS